MTRYPQIRGPLSRLRTLCREDAAKVLKFPGGIRRAMVTVPGPPSPSRPGRRQVPRLNSVASARADANRSKTHSRRSASFRTETCGARWPCSCTPARRIESSIRIPLPDNPIVRDHHAHAAGTGAHGRKFDLVAARDPAPPKALLIP